MPYILKGGKPRGKTAYYAGFLGGEVELTDKSDDAWSCRDEMRAEKERRVLYRLGYYMSIEKIGSDCSKSCDRRILSQKT